MVRICICSDNLYFSKYLKLTIKDYLIENKVQGEIDFMKPSKDFIKKINNIEIAYDIMILYTTENSIELTVQIRRIMENALILLISDDKKIFFDTFDLFPIQYILKEDNSQEKILKVMERCLLSIRMENKMYFSCKNQIEKKFINMSDILYFEVNGRKVTVYYDKANSFTFYSTIGKITEQLGDKEFVRCHRSFVVNISNIETIKKNIIILSNEKIIPIGRVYRKKLLESI